MSFCVDLHWLTWQWVTSDAWQCCEAHGSKSSSLVGAREQQKSWPWGERQGSPSQHECRTGEISDKAELPIFVESIVCIIESLKKVTTLICHKSIASSVVSLLNLA